MTRTTPWEDEYTLLCERCGYVVEGLDPAGNCPECGKPIAESLPERRVGTPWQNKPGVLAFASTCEAVLRTPSQTLSLMRFGRPSLGLLLIHILAGSYGFALLPAMLVQYMDPMLNEPPDAAQAAVWALFGVIPVGFALLTLTWIEASGLVFFGKRRGMRVNGSIAIQVCSHGAIGWSLGGILSGGGAAIAAAASHAANWDTPFMFMLPVAPLLAIAGFLFFEVFAYRGLRRCKFANRTRPTHAPPRGGGAGGEAD